MISTATNTTNTTTLTKMTNTTNAHPITEIKTGGRWQTGCLAGKNLKMRGRWDKNAGPHKGRVRRRKAAQRPHNTTKSPRNALKTNLCSYQPLYTARNSNTRAHHAKAHNHQTQPPHHLNLWSRLYVVVTARVGNNKKHNILQQSVTF